MLLGFQKNLYHNGLLLKDIHPQTEEMCLVAVRQNGMALRFVDEQTPEVSLAAVKQNGMALEFVDEQSPQICWAAYEQNPEAFKFIKSRKLRKEIEEKNKTFVLHPDMSLDEVIALLGKSKNTNPNSGKFEDAAPQKAR